MVDVAVRRLSRRRRASGREPRRSAGGDVGGPASARMYAGDGDEFRPGRRPRPRRPAARPRPRTPANPLTDLRAGVVRLPAVAAVRAAERRARRPRGPAHGDGGGQRGAGGSPSLTLGALLLCRTPGRNRRRCTPWLVRARRRGDGVRQCGPCAAAAGGARAHQLDRANSLITVEERPRSDVRRRSAGLACCSPWRSACRSCSTPSVSCSPWCLILTVRGHYRPRAGPAVTTIRADIGEGVRWLRGTPAARSHPDLGRYGVRQHDRLGRARPLRARSAASAGRRLRTLPAGRRRGRARPAVSPTPPLTRRVGRAVMLTAGSVVAAVAIGLMAFTAQRLRRRPGCARCFAAGVMVWNVLTMSLRQVLIPSELFGRVQGAYRTVVWGGDPGGRADSAVCWAAGSGCGGPSCARRRGPAGDVGRARPAAAAPPGRDHRRCAGTRRSDAMTRAAAPARGGQRWTSQGWWTRSCRK